jgi:hypothetical protein
VRWSERAAPRRSGGVRILERRQDPLLGVGRRPGRFFGTSTSNTHHVGIWLGNGNMIDALHTGSNVETYPVSAGGTIAGYSDLDG